jgi:tRNA A-37 threonylcarbamoyl transferase component Bud32
MSDPTRRFVARPAAIALGLTAVALLAAGGWVQSTAAVPPAARETAAAEARARNLKVLTASLDGLGARAADAAQVPNLIAALDSNVDAETFQDLFDTEEWWAPVRAAFPLSAIIRKPDAAKSDTGRGDDVLARRGPEAFVRLGSRIIAEARSKKSASGFVSSDDAAYALAATTVGRAHHMAGNPPILMLGSMADDKLLAAVSDKTGDAVGLSSGRKLLAAAGPEMARQALADLVGREAQTAGARGQSIALDLHAADGSSPGLLASPVLVTDGLWLWVTGAAPPAPGLPQNALILFGLSALAALVAIGLFLTKRSAGADDGDTEDRAALGVRPTVVADAPTPALGLRRPGGSSPGIASGSIVRETLPMPRTSSPAAMASIDAGITPARPALAVAMSPVAAPKQMGRYRLIKQIGEGGMAEIYIAAAQGPEGFERHFVVKRLLPQLAGRKEMVSQFIDEARLQARLLHSNIVSVFDFGTAGEEFFMALEYVHGRDFQQVVDRHVQVMGRPLSVALVFYVASEVLEALAYAHARTSATGEPLGIVHRDISPANVLVSFLGEVKLSDFGIVKAEERVSQTDHGVIKGNVSYMSPEQARSENVDLRSDLFSLGMMMFYALTGRTFYQSETMMGRLMLAAMGPTPDQLQALQELPAEAAAILEKALATDPAARYQTSDDFARALAGGLTGARTELSDTLKEIYDEETRREY